MGQLAATAALPKTSGTSSGCHPHTADFLHASPWLVCSPQEKVFFSKKTTGNLNVGKFKFVPLSLLNLSGLKFSFIPHFVHRCRLVDYHVFLKLYLVILVASWPPIFGWENWYNNMIQHDSIAQLAFRQGMWITSQLQIVHLNHSISWCCGHFQCPIWPIYT